ncbi:MAG: disulfide bond formation protein B [Acidimicrobiales bacterium]
MSRDSIVLFLSLLALFAQVTVIVVVAVFVVPIARPVRTLVIAQLGPTATSFAWLVAGVSMAGSLYLSEGAHFMPCKLCWYQRIAMYSLALILAVAALRRRRDVAVYAAPLAGVGVVISTYHMMVERFPRLESNVCDLSVPCTVIWTKRFGIETIPTMAFSGFLLILVTLFVGRRFERTSAVPLEEE